MVLVIVIFVGFILGMDMLRASLIIMQIYY